MNNQILCRLGELAQSRPGLHSPPTAVAAWYRRKAALFELIAADGGAEADDARSQAELARRRALRLTENRAA
ncbi:hypothetical protein GCM10022243_14950 [Saccharothrix violaceirubra]|uniref:Uncharacterized protein n=1 Tax=Saccharothrix violaceirubra TaxID=413306 RepID=A0A7W7WXE7_9PSEU|nr:hypothetical protein [Saccharothrix violaceirubra]MBB4967369.1 hypothetical protein [Saccharothrix violaceirubra]